MIKTIYYTKGNSLNPASIEDLWSWVRTSGKIYACLTGEDDSLSNVVPGDRIISTKGNTLWVLEVVEGNDTSRYCAKVSNITGIAEIKHFNQTTNTKSVKTISNFSDRIKSMFMPQEATNVRIATDGNICVATNDGYVAIDKNNNLTAYPEELTLKLPTYTISKPKEQLQVGDVVALDRSYAKVVKIEGDKITAIGYSGTGRVIHPIKDFLFQQTMVRVVVSLAGNIGGTMNPMLLYALSKSEGEDNSLLPLLMMSQQNGSLGMNPMMLMLFSGKDIDTKDLLLMSAMSGNTNPFGGLFAQPIAKDVVAPEAGPNE